MNEIIEDRTKRIAGWKIWTVLILLITVLLAGLTVKLVNKTAQWFDNNTIRLQSPFRMTEQKMVLIEKKQEKQPIVQFVFNDEVEVIDTPIEQKIYEVFGKDTPTALAVCKAESGCDCNRIHVNDNGSVDFGAFQINSVHMDRWTLEELGNCDRNIEIAKILVDEQGWDIWAAYTNGSWFAYLNR